VLEGGVAAIVVGREGLDGTEAIWHDRGLRSLAAVGMGSADSRSGLLVVGRTEAWPFDPDELSTLQNLAVETSLALASADLVSRAEELAVLGERLKLAREIHDGLASDLSAVVALFKYHEQRRETDPEEAERLLQQMRGLVEDALRGARDILATLRPRQRVEGTLPEAVRRLADEFSRTYGVTAVISVLGGDEELIEEERDTIYQVLREALTNVRKHAAAAAIEVRLDLRGRPFVLTVDDDGVGIDVDNLGRKPGSFGITGMRERAELIGAWVEISPRPQGGTRVMLRGAGPTA
jgi:signal transduction histidine kinase